MKFDVRETEEGRFREVRDSVELSKVTLVSWSGLNEEPCRDIRGLRIGHIRP